MSNTHLTDHIKYIGANDKTLDLFESQYKIPNGVSYNSYLILGDKIAVMDTVDCRATGEWLRKMNTELAGREPDYLIISHMEPDHAANVQVLAERYPKMQIVTNAKTIPMMKQFFTMDFTDRIITVAEGDTLELGTHTLQFFMAPMVHWPEVMVAYEQSQKILFSADGFGKFGSLDAEEEWLPEARRYFINIVGKYGNPVQALLKKAATLDIQMIAPLHGPILREDLGYYIGKYLTWSSYEPEEEGILLAYASIHGNTRIAAEKMKELLEQAGAKKVVLMDLSRDDMAQAVANAFRFDKMVLACATYDGGLFPCMEDFLNHLKAKTYQKRTVALIENGTWGPVAAKQMRAMLETMKDITVLEDVVTIRSTVKSENIDQMKALAEQIVK